MVEEEKAFDVRTQFSWESLEKLGVPSALSLWKELRATKNAFAPLSDADVEILSKMFSALVVPTHYAVHEKPSCLILVLYGSLATHSEDGLEDTVTAGGCIGLDAYIAKNRKAHTVSTGTNQAIVAYMSFEQLRGLKKELGESDSLYTRLLEVMGNSKPLFPPIFSDQRSEEKLHQATERINELSERLALLEDELHQAKENNEKLTRKVNMGEQEMEELKKGNEKLKIQLRNESLAKTKEKMLRIATEKELKSQAEDVQRAKLHQSEAEKRWQSETHKYKEVCESLKEKLKVEMNNLEEYEVQLHAQQEAMSNLKQELSKARKGQVNAEMELYNTQAMADMALAFYMRHKDRARYYRILMRRVCIVQYVKNFRIRKWISRVFRIMAELVLTVITEKSRYFRHSSKQLSGSQVAQQRRKMKSNTKELKLTELAMKVEEEATLVRDHLADIFELLSTSRQASDSMGDRSIELTRQKLAYKKEKEKAVIESKHLENQIKEHQETIQRLEADNRRVVKTLESTRRDTQVMMKHRRVMANKRIALSTHMGLYLGRLPAGSSLLQLTDERSLTSRLASSSPRETHEGGSATSRTHTSTTGANNDQCGKVKEAEISTSGLRKSNSSPTFTTSQVSSLFLMSRTCPRACFITFLFPARSFI